MALNWAMLNQDRIPVNLPRESTITTIDSGVEVILIMPDSLPNAQSTSGGSGGQRRSKAMGRIFLTDQRLVFVGPVPNGPGPSLETLSVPLHCILSTKFEQPYLGSNYLTIDVGPTPGGGLTEGTKMEIRLKDQGLFQFINILEKTRERAIYMRRQAIDDEETLPAYPSPSPSGAGPPSSSVGGLTPVPDDNPPGYDV